jgi:protein-disulfide isomerase
MEFSVQITRREFTAGTAALAIVAGLGGIQAAFAQSQSDLMQAGPLEEMVLGSANAPVTVIEYASMTCGHCANFAVKTFPELKSKYIDTGKVRFIFREFPLDPLAAAGFMLARCAGGTDKYFAIVDTLFHQQKDWVVQQPLAPLKAIAKQAGFTEQSFETCLADQKLLENLEKVRQRASDVLKVNSTPTFFINGKVHRGDIPLAELEKQIQAAL